MIIVLGMAGSGKSTQCRKLVESRPFHWVSVGELIRRGVVGENRQRMLDGEVLSDMVVMPIVEEALRSQGDEPEILLDGCPRTVGQAHAMVAQSYIPLRGVLHFELDEATAKQRLLLRGRQDDTESSISERFHAYEAAIQPIFKVFSEAGIRLLHVNACPDEETVFAATLEAINGLD